MDVYTALNVSPRDPKVLVRTAHDLAASNPKLAYYLASYLISRGEDMTELLDRLRPKSGET